MKLDYEITTCCPECGATFKTEQEYEICLNCSNEFETEPNQILTDQESEL